MRINSQNNIKTWASFKNINVYIDQKQILSDINIKFNYGENILILGPNGSGKSTFLKLLNRSIYPIISNHSSLKLFNEDFSVRDGRRCFFLSRMMSKDESKYLLIRKTLNYADFLEAICRLVDNLQIPTKAELKANEVSTFSELLIKRQIEHAVGDDTLDGWNSVGMHKAWKMKEPMTGSLLSKLSIMMPFLVDQIKNSIAIGKIKSVERAKIKNQSL